MEKARKLKEVELTCTKVEVKTGEDWINLSTEGLPKGLYLGEDPEGGMFIFSVNEYGDRNGMWLPIGEVIKFNVDKEQKTFVSALLEFEGRLKKVENLVCNNNSLIADVADEKAEPIIQSLINMEKQIKEIPKQTEGQKSSLTEMGEVVVNIIKATK